jgi:hypothetical protein
MKKRETPNAVSFNKRPQHHKRIGESGDEFYSSNDGDERETTKDFQTN